MHKYIMPLILIACGEQPSQYYQLPSIAQESQANDIVWQQTYNMWQYDSPKVNYVETNCRVDGMENLSGIWDGYNCVEGYHPWYSHQVYIRWFKHYWYSSYSHELMHEKLELLTGDPDKDHLRFEWNTEVIEANNKLKEIKL